MNKKLILAAFAALAFFGCSDDDDDCEVCSSTSSSTNTVKEGTGTVYTMARSISYVTQNDSSFIKIQEGYCDYEYGATGVEFTWYELEDDEEATYYYYEIANDSLYLTYAYCDDFDEDYMCEEGGIDVEADYSTIYYGSNSSITGEWKDLGIEIEDGEYTQYLSAYMTDLEFTEDSVYENLYASDNYPYGAISTLEDAFEVAFYVWPDLELDDDYNIVVDEDDEDWLSILDATDDSLTLTVYGDTLGFKWAYAANSAEYGYEYTLSGNGTSCENFYWAAYLDDRQENCNLEGWATRRRYNDDAFYECAQGVVSSTNEILDEDDYYDKTSDVNKLEKARVAFTKAVDTQLRLGKRK